MKGITLTYDIIPESTPTWWSVDYKTTASIKLYFLVYTKDELSKIFTIFWLTVKCLKLGY